MLLRESSIPDIGVVVLATTPNPRLRDGTAAVRLGGPRLSAAEERVRDSGAQLVAAIESVAAGGSVLDAKIVEPLVAAKARVLAAAAR